MDDRSAIIFAGGGTGGHIFQNLAVLERLRERGIACDPYFFVSSRPLDAAILSEAGHRATPLTIEPPGSRPWYWPRRLGRGLAGLRLATRITAMSGARAMVVTGGFVSMAAAHAARRCNVPLAVVNLDAVPGRANRHLGSRADKIFTAAPWPAQPHAVPIGVPLRRCAVGGGDVAASRRGLGLDPHRDTLLVVGGSQGAATLNALGPALAGADMNILSTWQWLHLAGSEEAAEVVRTAYRSASVSAVVLAFTHAMGPVWRSATLALSRAGAGSVAEAWANEVPTVFLPYPHHRDQHQRLNALPMADVGAALILEDRVDVEMNARAVVAGIEPIIAEPQRLATMRRALVRGQPGDGAEAVAAWVAEIVGSPTIAHHEHGDEGL